MTDANPPFLPFARPDIGDAEVEAVARALRSGWVTTGPETRAFEQEFAACLGGGVHAVAVNSATAGPDRAEEAVGAGARREAVGPGRALTPPANTSAPAGGGLPPRRPPTQKGAVWKRWGRKHVGHEARHAGRRHELSQRCLVLRCGSGPHFAANAVCHLKLLHCTTHESKLALSSHDIPRMLLLVEMSAPPPGPHLAMNSAAVITCG